MSEQHQKSLVRCAQSFIETMDNTSVAVMDQEEENFLIEDQEKLSTITKTLDEIHDQLVAIDAQTLRCQYQYSNLLEQQVNTQNESLLQKSGLNTISINQNVLRQDMRSLKQEVEDVNETISLEPDGTIVWKIGNVQEKTYDAQSERQTSIYSSPFYTSPQGYKLCLRLYLNGDGSARGSHISIFLVILRGFFDALLKWPFSYRVSFCLCDQRTMIETNGEREPKHIVESFRPDTNSVSFQRPCSAMNIASGIPKFYPLTEFHKPANENLYVVNDTIFIKAFVDFEGLHRSIIPFIFNLNIGFPAHIRQKLISEEIKRQQEQSTS